MSENDEVFPEPFGPQYVRPANADCPACHCCTVALCERGRASVRMCVGHVDEAHTLTVQGCPCSAESTAGTLAWRASLVHAVTLAVESPLPAEVEDLLHAVADEKPVGVPDLMPQLTGRGLVRCEECRPVVTDAGRAYLEARTVPRYATPVLVRSVDRKAGTAEVTVMGWNLDVPVTVPVDQLVAYTGVKADDLTGQMLEAVANCGAAGADEVVLTAIRLATEPVDETGGVPERADAPPVGEQERADVAEDGDAS